MHQAFISASLKYLLYMPSDYQPDDAEKWPLILFLHGSGERGDDSEKIKSYGLPRELERRPDFPFIVLSPLCPANMRWTDIGESVVHLLDEIIARYDIDPHRVYLSGFSMGAEGAWFLAVHHPQRFAAVVPVAGRIPPDADFLEKLCVLKDMPTWVFHGTADEYVAFENSQKLVEKLKGCGGNVRFTVYEGFKHGQTSDATYANDDLYAWLRADHSSAPAMG